MQFAVWFEKTILHPSIHWVYELTKPFRVAISVGCTFVQLTVHSKNKRLVAATVVKPHPVCVALQKTHFTLFVLEHVCIAFQLSLHIIQGLLGRLRAQPPLRRLHVEWDIRHVVPVQSVWYDVRGMVPPQFLGSCTGAEIVAEFGCFCTCVCS